MRGARLGLALLCWLVGGALAAEAQTSVNHATTCTGAATPSTSDIDCPAWMADHVFTGGAQGYMLYRDTGEANGANWTDQVRFDETLVNLGLFGGTIGTDGSRVLSVSCASSVAPTTTPEDTVQWWCEDIGGGPGTAGAVLRTEPDGGFRILDGTQIFEVLLTTSGGVTYAQASGPLILGTIGTAAMKLSFGNTGIYGNFYLGDPDATVGTDGEKVLLHTLGVCPSTSPADAVQICVEDIAGAGTATAKHRDELGNVTPLGHLTNTATYDPASMLTLTSTSTTITVTGASVGNPALCGLTTLTTEDVQITAVVSAADTVRVLLQNISAGTIDLTSGTLRCSVWRY